MALKPNANALIAPCSAPFSDAQQIVHHDEMTAVDGKVVFFTEFMAHFVGKNAIITHFEVKRNGYTFNPIIGNGQTLVRPLKIEGVDCLGQIALR